MFESPYTGHDFVQFGKTKSVLNKRAQELALLFNPPSVLSLENIPKFVSLENSPMEYSKKITSYLLT